MKPTPFVLVLSAGLAAQAPELPRSLRDVPIAVAKGEPLPVKNGVAPATALPQRDQEPLRLLPAAERPVAEVASGGLLSVFADPDFVAFDEPPEGSIWAVGQSFKAAFDDDGFRFIGRPAVAATELQPIAFRLAAAVVDGSALPLAAPVRARRDRRVTYERGSVVEALDVAGDGIEQSFSFARLPVRGELVLELSVSTALAAEATADGIVFRGPFDAVRYSPAVAIDADGARVAVPTTFADGRITLRVPAEFVAHAALPLTIDPKITNTVVATYTNDVGDPDLAWDESNQLWAVVFSRLFAAGDWDCYVQLVSGTNPMTLIGPLSTIDSTSTSWQRPRIANLDAYPVFMVVAQTKAGTAPWQVQGRMMGNLGTVFTGPLTIAASSVDQLHPDIGGNPNGPPAYFTVVWEYAFSTTDHDIYARLVESTGTMHTAAIAVQSNGANQTWPSISKACGGNAGTTAQRFGIVYQQTFQPNDEDIYGSLLTWDGQHVVVNNTYTFPIDTTPGLDVMPSVSSPTILQTNGRRLLLAAWERDLLLLANPSDIVAACFDSDGNVLATGNLSQLEQNPTRQAWPQYRPSVDTDGLRFLVGYHETYQGNTTINDLDTRATVVGLHGSALMVEEAGTTLGFTGNREFNIQVASRYSSYGLPEREFNTVNDRDGISGGGFAIDAYRFDVAPFGLSNVRATGCGSLSISWTGSAIPGGTFAFHLSSPLPITGFLVGTPISAPIAPCPGCVLGVDGFLVTGLNYTVHVPTLPPFVGTDVSAQGFALDPSGCVGLFQLSDTIDITIG